MNHLWKYLEITALNHKKLPGGALSYVCILKSIVFLFISTILRREGYPLAAERNLLFYRVRSGQSTIITINLNN
jgi:hypothetical protein